MSAIATGPRLGFLGVGWIGRDRMDAIAADGSAEVAAVADPAVDGALAGLDDLLEQDLDGIVIATPSALHAEQAIAALERGLAVFCQKPLGRTAAEARAVVDAARRADRLLGVDMSYRHTEAAQRVRDVLDPQGVFAADFVFHNSYGPDKAWFYDPALSGGGCVIDLGTHLIDLALWLLGWPRVEHVEGRLHMAGAVEEYAVAQLDLAGGAVVRIACSWNVPLGRDAEISARLVHRDGCLQIGNVDGSFYDFVAERVVDGRVETLASPPDDWGGRAAVAWSQQLAESRRFDAEIEHVVDVASVVDAIYGSRS